MSTTSRTAQRAPQITAELNISQAQVYALIRCGDLKAIQVGGRNQWRIERRMLEEYIAEAYRRTATNLASE